jgi:hypothetical protein
LADFKAWLSKDFIWDPFTTPEDLSGKITAALLKRQIGPASPPPPDPERYLRLLQGRTSDIEVRGLKVGSGDVLRTGTVPMRGLRQGIRKARKRGEPGWCGAALGAAISSTLALSPATATFPGAGTATSVFGWWGWSLLLSSGLCCSELWSLNLSTRALRDRSADPVPGSAACHLPTDKTEFG